MFLNKVLDQKIELWRVVFRNMYLKEKCDTLDNECKMLAEHILSNQVTTVEKREIRLSLEKELNHFRQLHDQNEHALSSANNQMMAMTLAIENSTSSVLNSLNENKSMNEELEVKNDMIKCLQEELVHVRLEAAEKWALIRELKQMNDELEKDKEMLTKTKPETISRLQEEFIAAKLLENEYSREFENIRKRLQTMKDELNAHTKQEDDGKNNTRKPEGNVNLSGKRVIWQSKEKNNKGVGVEISEEIKKMEEEKLFLENRIPDLQNKIEILHKHSEFKEVERSRLQEKIDTAKMKVHSLENITLERKRQYAHLESSASEKVFGIRNSSKEKNENIDELSTRLESICDRRQSNASSFSVKELKMIHSLEEHICILEERIDQLKSETKKLNSRSDSYSNSSEEISNLYT